MLCPDAYYFFWEYLTQSPGNYLEIGVFDGSGICEIARRFPDKTIYAIDPFIEDGYTIPQSNMPTGGKLLDQRYAFLKNATPLSNIVYFEMPSFYFLEKLRSEPEMIDKMNISAVFVDGSHHYHDVIVDCEIADMVLKQEGCIVFDDCGWIEGVNKAIAVFKEQYKHRIKSVINTGLNQ